jgi:hypothetical protein
MVDFVWQALQTPFKSYLSDMLALVSYIIYHHPSFLLFTSRIHHLTCPGGIFLLGKNAHSVNLLFSHYHLLYQMLFIIYVSASFFLIS